ncbi:MAG: hypothetical protein AAF649_08185 [Verrucomicrobiota bacterium]
MKNRVLIFLGMQRSGSTLQYNIGRKIIEGKIHQSDIVVFGALEPDSFDSFRDLVLSSKEKLILAKAHWLPEEMVQLLTSDHASFFYISRELKDVYYSGKRKEGWDLDDFSESIDLNLTSFSLLRETGADTLVQRYEDLMADMPSSTLEIARFLNIELSDQQVNEIARSQDVNLVVASQGQMGTWPSLRVKLRNSAKSLPPGIIHFFKRSDLICTLVKRYLGNKDYDGKSLIHVNHISESKGASGAWKGNISEKEIQFIDELASRSNAKLYNT